ncbi:hypothetical protein [Massilia glaciei]|uniref:Bro-N domain-containing protein n=1 Tax=Massilia glaciei TaxID=1524097 RepID=A0A2U2I7T2_9BURK|nr:hypothetical protein [Massilia glaciei]PWF55759.1 hypothetical protein C7C56_000165 [Massilia glaciei]
MGRLLLHLCAHAGLFYLAYRLYGAVPPDNKKHVLIALLLCAPLWARNIAPFVLAILPALHGKAKRDAHEAWNGRYYAFEGAQLRFVMLGEAIWVAADDLDALLPAPPDSRERRILGPDHGTIPGYRIKGYTENGMRRLLATRTTARTAKPQMIKLRHWLEHETLPNLRRLPGSAANR